MNPIARPMYPVVLERRPASLASTTLGFGGGAKLATTTPGGTTVVLAGGVEEAGVVVTKMLGTELEGVGCELVGVPDVPGAGGVTWI